MNDLNRLKNLFEKRFGHTDYHIYHAPGRVNLIGEHTDYNGGYVLPCSLDFGTYLLAGPNGKEQYRFASTNFEYHAQINLNGFSKQGGEWVNYPLGVIAELRKKGHAIKGTDFLFSGDIPNGAGLSSSASVEMATAVALNDLYQLGEPQLELVKLSQRAENNFVGVNCGIMDQFAVGMGRQGSALMLDCATLDYELVPLNLEGLRLIISNTNKRRGLADSKYNERRAECELAVSQISQKKPIAYLGQLRIDEFENLQDAITDPTVLKRARHVVSENKRVKQAVDALKKPDFEEFGRLMTDSHNSLRDDYQVTGPELDALVSAALTVEGVLGSRMTGAGFGGCTVSLVREGKVDIFKEKVGRSYEKTTGIKPDFYIANTGAGAGKRA